MKTPERLKVACVGTGYFSQFHYDAWTRIDKVDLVGVCNRTLSNAETFKETYQIGDAFDDLEDMLKSTKPDIVDVITPPNTHEAYVDACLKHGAHVICQKPFGEDAAAAARMVAMAEQANRQLIVHENFRFMPWYRKIKNLLDDKAIGEILNITFRLRPGDGQGEDAYLSRQPYFQKMPRFLVHETAIHLIDTFRFLMGEVTDVSARLRRCNPVILGEDSGLISFDFENGAQGLFDGNRCLDHAASNQRRTMGEMLVEGTLGSISLSGNGTIYLRLFGSEKSEEQQYHWQDKGFGGDCVYLFTQHVVEHFVSGTAIENTAAEYLRNVEIEDAVYRSNDEKRVISV
ncbi:Gfo/Idh/MocA family protein [Agaribacter flavus]|uniref:Gfo/Idh/MocA family protein n=1 Tax=Agaribacter flavus TaxID=1902781 RepID=A0ABV7FIM5_9ALTE